MLPKKIRLNPRNERDYFTLAKRVHSPYFTVFYQIIGAGVQVSAHSDVGSTIETDVQTTDGRSALAGTGVGGGTKMSGVQIAGGGGALVEIEASSGAKSTGGGGALVIVPKSVSKKAVVRNKLKRQFNQAILDAISEGEINIESIKMAISLKPSATTLTASQMKEKVISVVKDIKRRPRG